MAGALVRLTAKSRIYVARRLIRTASWLSILAPGLARFSNSRTPCCSSAAEGYLGTDQQPKPPAWPYAQCAAWRGASPSVFAPAHSKPRTPVSFPGFRGGYWLHFARLKTSDVIPRPQDGDKLSRFELFELSEFETVRTRPRLCAYGVTTCCGALPNTFLLRPHLPSHQERRTEKLLLVIKPRR